MPNSVARLSRAHYIALALLTIAFGLFVHRSFDALGPVAQDMLGDALWAMMMYWWVAALAPTIRVWPRSLAALGVCVVVELSQLIHTPALDHVCATTLGHLVLGSGFDPRDVLSYFLGVVAAVLLEWGASRAATRGTS